MLKSVQRGVILICATSTASMCANTLPVTYTSNYTACELLCVALAVREHDSPQASANVLTMLTQFKAMTALLNVAF